MAESVKVVGESLGTIFCPFCSIKLEGLKGGIKEKCPECEVVFSVRKY